MADHIATISWINDGEFRSGRYGRAHEWRFDGGAVVRGSSSPSVVPEPLSDPFGVDPEEALIASASSCHMLWFLSLAQSAGFEVQSYRDDAVGTVGKDEQGRVAITRIVLHPDIAFKGPAPGQEDLARLHHEAHAKCFIANSLKSEILVEPGGNRSS